MSTRARGNYGMELILDLYSCDSKTIRSRTRIAAFARALCRRIKMKRYGDPIVEHFGHKNPLTSGYSLVQLIETSCISAHFSEATNSAYLNVFSCKPFDPDDAAAFCREYFGAGKMRQRLIKRK